MNQLGVSLSSLCRSLSSRPPVLPVLPVRHETFKANQAISDLGLTTSSFSKGANPMTLPQKNNYFAIHSLERPHGYVENGPEFGRP